MQKDTEEERIYFDIYDHDVAPHLEDLEWERNRQVGWAALCCLGALVVFGVLAALLPKVFLRRRIGSMIISAMFATAAIPFCRFRINRKDKYVHLVLTRLDKRNVTYCTSSCLPRSELKLMIGASRRWMVAAEDGLSGSYGNRNFQFNEVDANTTKIKFPLRTEIEHVFHGWILHVGVGILADAIQSWCGKIKTIENGSVIAESTNSPLPPNFADPIREILELAETSVARIRIHERRLVLVVETARNLFEVVGDHREELTKRSFIRFAKEVDVVTRAAMRMTEAVELMLGEARREKAQTEAQISSSTAV